MPHHKHMLSMVRLTFLLSAVLSAWPALALETDRQQPLQINADASDGTLGDGKATLSGNVEISQGTMLVKAEHAEVVKVDGKVREVLLRGNPVLLQQEIEQQGLVKATAQTITYQVASGIVTLTGNADVDHPQYQISGESLVYDMNQQHFQGSGGDNNGRIRIQLEPEVLSMPNLIPADPAPADEAKPDAEAGSKADTHDANETSESGGDAAY